MSGQSASQFMIIRPAGFGFNPETSRTNHYQHRDERPQADIYTAALAELENLLALYQAHDIDVQVFENKDPDALDAIFPNSISTFRAGAFSDGRPGQRYAILHPMLDESRRRERSPELISCFTDRLGYIVKHDLSSYENDGRSLEGTGSVVMDHIHKVAYCALSDRTDPKVAAEYAALIGYEPVIFRTHDHNGRPVYHTDVLMYVGDGYIGLCTSCIHDEDRDDVVTAAQRHHELVDISMGQLRSFCGNAVQVQNRQGEVFLAMSTQAFKAMEQHQINIVEKHGVKIIHTDVSTVERYGGGSVRCMTQELF